METSWFLVKFPKALWELLLQNVEWKCRDAVKGRPVSDLKKKQPLSKLFFSSVHFVYILKQPNQLKNKSCIYLVVFYKTLNLFCVLYLEICRALLREQTAF